LLACPNFFVIEAHDRSLIRLIFTCNPKILKQVEMLSIELCNSFTNLFTPIFIRKPVV
jgi:hypothetical protein